MRHGITGRAHGKRRSRDVPRRNHGDCAATLAERYRPVIVRASSRARHIVSRLFCILFVILIPGLVEAKRALAPKIQPVVHEGVRYSVPNDEGRRAYIQAKAARSGKLLWELTIFRNPINPKLEEDVQWVFIKSLRVTKTNLTVVDERNRTWVVNLKSRAVIPKVNSVNQ
jgi:hypothetical protein